MARQELNSKTVKSQFENRVNQAADRIKSISGCRHWADEYGLDKQAVENALNYLVKLIDQCRKGEQGGFKL